MQNSVGYLKLRKAVDIDIAKKSNDKEKCEAKFKWVIDRAKHYAEIAGTKPEDILNTWEEDRDYWYINYYQDTNQPLLDSDGVKVFDTIKDFQKSAKESKYRCPYCKGVTTNPYTCNSGVKIELINKEGKHPCNWKVYGLFGDLGKGIFVFLKDSMRGETIFMPIAWENEYLFTCALCLCSYNKKDSIPAVVNGEKVSICKKCNSEKTKQN